MTAIIQGLTRAEIRQRVGRQLPGLNPGAMFKGSATTVPGGGADASSIVDAKLRGIANEHSGKWVVLNEMAVGDSNSGHIARVDSNTIDAPSSGDVDLTIVPSATDSIIAADSYELWDEEFNPADVNDAINEAITEATGRIYDPVVDTSLFCDAKQSRYSLPSDVYMIRRIERRFSAAMTVILSGGAAMDESVDSDFTITVDTEITKRQGVNKIVVGAGVSDGDFACDSITSKDISKYTHVELWVRVASDVAAADLRLLLDNTAACASPVETLDIPAVTAAERWKRVRIALANPESDTAIISVGLEYNANSKANTIWVGDITLIDADSERFELMGPNTWDVDSEARELIIKNPGAFGYNQIRIIGGDRPALLTSETAVSEVPEDFIIMYARAILLMGKTDKEGKPLAGPLFQQAQVLKRGFPALQGVRKAGG